MLVKFINETTIENTPKIIRDENKVYANPSEEILKAHGYKPLVEQECPNEEGFWYSFEYKENKTTITKTWIAHEIEAETEEFGDESQE